MKDKNKWFVNEASTNVISLNLPSPFASKETFRADCPPPIVQPIFSQWSLSSTPGGRYGPPTTTDEEPNKETTLVGIRGTKLPLPMAACKPVTNGVMKAMPLSHRPTKIACRLYHYKVLIINSPQSRAAWI